MSGAQRLDLPHEPQAAGRDAACYDVIVVGFGAAGAMAAYAAARAGARVLLLEKMAFPGGLSTASAGGIRISYDRDQTLQYLEATCGGRTPLRLLEILAEGMTRVSDTVCALAEPLGATVVVKPALGNYPLPGFESLGYCEVTEVPEIEGKSHHAMAVLSNGTRLFRVLEHAVEAAGVEIRLHSPVRRLLRADDGRVVGVVLQDGAEIRASGGVILACGGFEADPQMQRDYLQMGEVQPTSFLGNTGDGIRMAQAVGADLWHMWHVHGPYGLRHPDPDYPFGLFLKAMPMWTPGHMDQISDLGLDPAAKRLGDKTLPTMAWIVVDQGGRRFMNEYAPYPGDAGLRPFDAFDFQRQTFARNPAYMIFDEQGRQMYPMGRAVHNDPRPRYRWSADNLAEVEAGIFKRADTLEELAEMLGLPAAELQRTVADWNDAVHAGADPAHDRLPETMVPILTPPFYAGEVRPLVINTQGGPRHDESQRVLDPFGSPIPGLYAAGELGSLFGHLYMSGGNLAECLIGGEVAGKAAASAAFKRADPMRQGVGG